MALGNETDKADWFEELIKDETRRKELSGVEEPDELSTEDNSKIQYFKTKIGNEPTKNIWKLF